MPKSKVLYCVAETKRGGKRRRYCGGSTGTKNYAGEFAKAMRRNFGDKFTYRVVRKK